MFQIEKDVPIPARKAGKFPPCRYPYAEMAVGDSFLIETTDDDEARRKQVDAQIALRDWRKRSRGAVNGFAVTTRQTWDGVRVWRTK